MSETKWKSYEEINDYKYPMGCTEETVNFAQNYKPLNSDKLVVTYPKCGTTWTQQIIYLILNDGIPVKNDKQFIFDTFLEFTGEKSITKPIVKTHLPFHLMPYNENAKYLLVFRNPKDTCVSLYYHIKAVPVFDLKMNFHQFFDEWINGQIFYGDYFQHNYDYWLHRMDDNIQYLIYERMKQNPREAVLKIAEFLGKEFVYKLKENDELILNRVLEYSTIDYMKTDANNNEYIVRKGIIGDWKMHFNKEESDLVDRKIKQYFGGTELEKTWEPYMKW